MNTENTDNTTPPLGFWLRLVDGLLAREFAAALDAEGVTRREWRILQFIDDSAVTPEAAERLRRKGKLLHGLDARGWITETDDGWTLTEDGRAAKERLSAAVDGVRAKVAAAVAPEDYTTTVTALQAIARELGWDESQRMPRGPHHGFGPGRGRAFSRRFAAGRGFGPAGFGPAGFGPAGFGPAGFGPAGFGPAGFEPGFGPGFGRGFAPRHGFAPGHGFHPRHGFDPADAADRGFGRRAGFGRGFDPDFGPGHGFGRRAGFGPHAGLRGHDVDTDRPDADDACQHGTYHGHGHDRSGAGHPFHRGARGHQRAQRAFERGFAAGFDRGAAGKDS